MFRGISLYIDILGNHQHHMTNSYISDCNNLSVIHCQEFLLKAW